MVQRPDSRRQLQPHAAWAVERARSNGSLDCKTRQRQRRQKPLERSGAWRIRRWRESLFRWSSLCAGFLATRYRAACESWPSALTTDAMGAANRTTRHFKRCSSSGSRQKFARSSRAPSIVLPRCWRKAVRGAPPDGTRVPGTPHLGAHERRAGALLAEIRLRRMVTNASDSEPFHNRTVSSAGRVLLASIVGMAIASLWLWIAVRAGR
jgi:hypothetical protein